MTIEGPSKVKMDCHEVPEGYRVQYTPMAPGNYLVSIKYGGANHVAGSPFKAKVTGRRTSVFPAEPGRRRATVTEGGFYLQVLDS